MPENDWRMPDATEYSVFQHHLLENKGGDAQENFLRNISKGPPFLAQVDGLSKKGSKSYPAPDWEHAFTYREFINPPPCTEAQIYEHWKELSPFVASRPSFWAQATTDVARAGYIHPNFLAGVRGVPGEQRIARILSAQPSKERDNAIDACVRDVLRRMSGIQRDRGNRSIFVNCILARAWWRERLVRRVAREIGETNLAVGVALRMSAQHWEYFATAMVSRNPVFGNEVVQNAAVANFMDLELGVPASVIQKVCQQICVAGASQELSIISAKEIGLLMGKITQEIQDNRNVTKGASK